MINLKRPSLVLIRLEESELGTRGVLTINTEIFCVTLEPPDTLNAYGSNINPGQYLCKRYISVRYPKTFEVTGVVGKTNVLFHAGNTKDHTLACILLAESFGKLEGDRAVLNSGTTFRNFMSYMENTEEFWLTIREVY